MNTLPKPQPCGQPWLAMQPTANGRRCGHCEKEIYDFSAMSWPDIARTQAAHGHALCGMYAPAQLARWGQSPPAGPCARLAAATTLALALSTLSVRAQTPPAAATATLSGTVRMATSRGKTAPLPGATVLLAGTQIGVTTDHEGRYELVLPLAEGRAGAATVVYTGIGFVPNEWALTAHPQDRVQHDVLLALDPRPVAVFSVRRPSVFERARWALKRWFGKGQE